MKWRSLHTAIYLAFSLIMLQGLLTPLKSQEDQEKQRIADSVQVLNLYDDARSSFIYGQPYEALNTLGEALQAAMQLKLTQVESHVLDLIGDIYISEGNAEEALPYYLRVASMYEFVGDSAKLQGAYKKIGAGYSTMGVHEKSGEYLLKARNLLEEGRIVERMEFTEALGKASLLSGNAERAKGYFLQFEKMLLKQGENILPAWTHLVSAYRETGQFDSCLIYSERMLDYYKKEEINSEIALLQNNMGYYFTLLEQFPQALEHYGLAVEHAEQTGLPEAQISSMKANMGVCYQNMNKPDEAKDLMNQALGGLKNEDHFAESSRIENLQALIFFNENDLYNAGLYCREAISSAEEAADDNRLADAYLTYSRVLRAGNDPVNALQYYESYLAIRDSLQLEAKLSQEQMKQRISRLDRSESDLLIRLKEEQVNELAINRLTLQLEREEQSRELLLRENDLQLLEQERLRQSLVITEQQYKVEQQERQNRILEQEQRIANFALEQEQQKQKEAELEISLLEQQQRHDQLSLEKQKEQRRALIGTVILMILVVILVTGSLVLTRKKNLLLARQKKEIEEKNLDLEYKNEEISAQRDEIEAQRDEIEAQRNMVYEQKAAIEQYSGEVTNSIEYAQRIQSTTLPDLELLRDYVSDYFLLFRPRDIVSGDFYWLANVEGSTVLSVADCTGHGVPGAFMSVMGMSLLKEIVQKEYFTHPGVILRRMRKEIIKSLGQKGESGEQRDGMDMALIEINHEEKLIQYAGAYNSLYLIRKNTVKAPDIADLNVMEGEEYTLYDIPADRMPIAYYERMDKFTTHRIPVEDGDQLYLYTDGYADQFGGENGKKFKYKPFKRLILENAALSMEKQYNKLAQTLDKWQGDFDQVDDICMIGLKF